MFKKAKWKKACKKAKTESQKLFKELDDLWRKAVKIVYGSTDSEYYQCEKCGKWFKSGKGIGTGKGINAHHIIGKSNYNVRWEIEDGTPLCSGCHTMRKDSAHQDRTVFLNWIINKRGQEWFGELMKKAGREGGSKKWTIAEMTKKKEELEELVEEFKKETNENNNNL